MKTLVFESEVKITEKQYKKFKAQGYKLIFPESAFAQVFGKDIKLVRGYIVVDAGKGTTINPLMLR